MTRRWSSGARPGKPAAAAPGEDSNGTIGEYCSGTDRPTVDRMTTRASRPQCLPLDARLLKTCGS